MTTSHHDREEETLIAYFQQMLAEVDDQEFNGEIQAQAHGSMAGSKVESSAYSAQANQAVLQSANAAIESNQNHIAASNVSTAATAAVSEVAQHTSSAPQEHITTEYASVNNNIEGESVANPFGGMAHLSTTDMLTSEMSMADDVEVIDNPLVSRSQESTYPTEQATGAEVQEQAVPVSASSERVSAPSVVERAAVAPSSVEHVASVAHTEHAESSYDNAPSHYQPEMQPQLQTQVQTDTRQYAVQESDSNLQRLLSTIDTSDSTAQTQVALAAKIAQATATATASASASAPAVEVASAAVETAVESVVETPVEVAPAPVETVAAPQVATVEQNVTTKQIHKTHEQLAQESMGEKVRGIANEWKNVDLGEQFQALFFLAQGVRFAVPLIDLGGIFECDKITQLFGKPDWFMGITDVRGTKINIVDTLRWVMPNIGESPDKYPYLIALGTSHWSIGCDVLEGNRSLNSSQVKWREIPGSRPWLAGIVTSDKCALLHVNALISLFDAGAGIEDLVRDLEEGKEPNHK